MPFLKEILPLVLADLESPKKAMRSRLMEIWPSLAGPKIAAHTRPILSENGDLKIWVDQASLAYELNQRYKQALLKRVKAAFGENEINSIRFLVGQLR